MVSINVTILEQNDIYHYSTSDREPKLAMFWYKDEDKYFINNEEFYRELGFVYISAVLVLHNENDFRIAKDQILERRKKNLGIETTEKSDPSSSMHIKFYFW